MRTERPVTEPSTCRSCGAEILWVQWARSGKRMPVDSLPDPNGKVVLTLRKAPEPALLAETFDPKEHLPDRRRFTSHFTSCPNASQHRRSA
jgi:hypothetical protein